MKSHLHKGYSVRKIYLRNMKLKIISSIFLFSFYQLSLAQSGFVSAWGDDSSNDGNITFSIGQTYYNSTSFSFENSYYLNEGLQIPYIEYLPLKVKLNIVGYPNPTTNVFNLLINDFEMQNQDLKYYLFNVDGRLVLTDKIEQKITILNLGFLPRGVYLLRVEGWVVQGNIKIIKVDEL